MDMKANKYKLNMIHITLASVCSMISVIAYYKTGQSILAVDNKWYLEAGTALLAGKASIDQIFLSPMFSLITYYLQKLSLLTYLNIIILNGLFISFSITLWSLLFLLPRQACYLFDFDNKQRLKAFALCSALLAVNPYILKYSFLAFSDSFSLIAGCIFVIHYCQFELLSKWFNCNRQKSFIDPSSLLSAKYFYYLTIITLSLFRYLNFILIVTSLLVDCFYFTVSRRNRASWLRYIIPLVLILFILICSKAFYLFLNTYFPNSFDEINSYEIILYFNRLWKALFMTTGAREGFRFDGTLYLNIFSFEQVRSYFQHSGYYISSLEYVFSISYMIAMPIITFISFYSISRISKTLFLPMAIGVIVLLSIEAVIGVAHQRYFLMFIPAVYYGISLYACALYRRYLRARSC